MIASCRFTLEVRRLTRDINFHSRALPPLTRYGDECGSKSAVNDRDSLDINFHPSGPSRLRSRARAQRRSVSNAATRNVDSGNVDTARDSAFNSASRRFFVVSERAGRRSVGGHVRSDDDKTVNSRRNSSQDDILLMQSLPRNYRLLVRNLRAPYRRSIQPRRTFLGGTKQ